MGKKYTKDDTLKQTEEAVKDMTTFYRAECVNHAGTTYKRDGDEYYTEIISEYLLENYDMFDKISKITRGNYKVETHNGTTPRPTSNRKEERIALSLYRFGVLHPLGRIIDYQTPLKSKQTDGAGKIDLIAFDDSTGILRLIELKAPGSNETLLRCVSEIYTYYKTVDSNNLAASFNLEGKCKEIRICALFFKDSNQDEEYDSIADRPALRELMYRISDDTVRVELIRFPYDFWPYPTTAATSPASQNGSASDSQNDATKQTSSVNKSKPYPIVDMPGKIPMDVREINEIILHEPFVEILDY